MHQFVRTHRLGRCFGAETGFLLSSDPDTVRAPDFAFVSTARLPGGHVPPGYFPGAPELAVEVLSPSESPQEVKQKLRAYFAAGCRLVWIVDPLAQTIRVYAAPSRSRTLTIDDELAGGDVLPGFRCPVREIFET